MTRLLVDTPALLWWLTDDRSLSACARDAIADPVNEPLVSVASLWEVAIKRSLGRLSAPDDLPERIVDLGFGWLAVEPPHAWKVRELPGPHGDPFDRILIAQALVEGVPIVTADVRFADYPAKIVW